MKMPFAGKGGHIPANINYIVHFPLPLRIISLHFKLSIRIVDYRQMRLISLTV
jgi:hypothetical protein